MRYELKNCRDGSAAIYPSTVDITEQNGVITFHFEGEHTSFYCPYKEYNKLHCKGDACEILIGSDPERKVYYEIEISARGNLMLAKMTYKGVDEIGFPVLDVNFVENCFVKGRAEETEKGYTATISINKQDIMTGDGDIFFNAYRLETDGGEMEKHLFALNPTMRGKFHAPDYYLWLKDYL